MLPPRVSSAESTSRVPAQEPAQVTAAMEAFFSAHPQAVVLEDGKAAFDLATAKWTVSSEHGRCTLHLWNDERNLVRRILAAVPRNGVLRLTTQKFGQTQTKLLELAPSQQAPRVPSTRDATRQRYLKTLQRVLLRHFPEWKLDSLRTAMDLERSFGPAYARGIFVRGQQAWALIGVNESESAPVIDGVLTIGILWLDHCRALAGGRRLFAGLKLIVPRGFAATTLARLKYLNQQAAQWELYELDEREEELMPRDADDQGNLNTRLIHHPDASIARERFQPASAQVLSLIPAHQQDRVEQRLRSSAEMVFRLHGLEFARARMAYTGNSFQQRVHVTVGVGESETELTADSRPALKEAVAELFRRRDAASPERATDPLYRAQPERWLESVLRLDLSPLTRHLAPSMGSPARRGVTLSANELDPDTLGNRITPPVLPAEDADSRLIPRLDPQHVYAQVPAIAGARDRGMLDLLGVTADGRLAVIELKAEEDLQLAMQGLDYWVRVRHHHLQTADTRTGLGEFQRHGYFLGMELSPQPPRLYLVAPALRIHPATETVLRYLSPQVEWHLLALDERWRERVRVVWRKQSR